MMMMEGSSVPEVRPMMHLLRESCDRGDTIDAHLLHQMLKRIYRNITSIHRAIIALLEDCGRKFHQGSDLPYQYRWMTEDVGMVITFCRCQLNCMVNEDGLINNASALFLEKIEGDLLINVKVLTDYLSREELVPSRIESLRIDHTDGLADEIEPVYQAIISRHEASLMPSNLLIGSEFILEFINQVHLDLQHQEDTASAERETMKGYLVLLRYYVECSTTTMDRINGEEMNDFLISSQLVASKMAYYSYLTYHASRPRWNKTFVRISHRTQSDIRLGCLRAAMIFPQHFSSSIPAMNSEVLIIYANCIQDNMKDEAFCDLTSSMINQFTILQSGLSFLKFQLASSGQNTADLEKLSDIRVRFQALLRNVGSLTLSCFNKEMDGSITSLLSDFIETVNLIEDEIIENIEGSVKEVRGKMYRLHQGCGHHETSDDLHQKFEDVYRNFTSIHTALIALLEKCARKFHQSSSDLPNQYRRMREDFGMVITFCRCQLNWMVNEDGLINTTSALLLEKIERNLLINIEVLSTDYLSREELAPGLIEDRRRGNTAAVADEIEPVYQAIISRHEASLMPSNMLIRNEFVLEFLSQVHQDLQHEEVTASVERETMRGYLVLMRYYYLECSTMDINNGEEMNEFLISSHLAASKMAYYSFLTHYACRDSWNKKFASIRHRTQSDIRLGCLRAAMVLPQHVSSSIPAMNIEVLIIYVNCIQDNLSDLLKDEAFCDLTSSMINQFTTLQSGLSFLKFLLAGSGLNTADPEKLSDIMVRAQALVRNVGSLTLSYFNKKMNEIITPLLFDFIENVNLIEEESVKIREGSVTEICWKMYRLHQGCGRGETFDDLHQKFKDIYRNLTSTLTAVIDILETCGRKFHRGSSDPPYQYRSMREDLGMVITFCRCQLINWMINVDGLINNSSALLLDKIERSVLINVEVLTDYLSREELAPGLIEDLRRSNTAALADEIEPVYQAIISRHEASLMPSNLLIRNEFFLEFLNQVHQDLQHGEVTASAERETMRGYLVLLRYYLEYSAMNRINGEVMNEFLISSQLVASKMAYYSYLSYYAYRDSWNKRFTGIRHCVESEIRFGCLRAASVLPYHVSSSISSMSTELLIIYVNCIQDNLSDFREDEAFIDLRNQITDQLTTRPRGLLMIPCADFGPPTSHLEKLSNIRVWFRALVRNVGLLTVLCLNDEMKGSLTSELSDLIKKVELVKEETIDDMYFIVLGRSGHESLRIHRLHYLIILFENLEDLIDSKSDLIMTWKDQSDAFHRNLVLFRSFIHNFQGNSITHDGSENSEEVDYSEEEIKTQAEKIQLLRNYLQLDNEQMNCEEMSELLISAQLTAFELACHYLFRRHGEVCWWKAYVRTIDRVDLHMRVGVLGAAVLSLEKSSTLPLSDELLMGYLDCVQDNMIELVKVEASDQMKGLLERLQKELIKLGADKEKLSDIKLRFQALLRNIGSVICSCFTNRLSHLVTEQSTDVADLIDKLNILQDETQGFQYMVILNRIRQQSPKVHLPGFFDLLLHNWKDFMDCESDTARNKKAQCQEIHEILVLFRSFINNFTTCPTGDEEERKLYSLITEAGYVAEYLLDSFALEACPISCTSCWISELTVHIKRIKDIMVDNRKIPALRDVMVGFEAEMKLIMRRLYNRKPLDVISIVGMPGSGKTTLAKKVYEDPSTEKHFDVRAWCIVSQEYNRKEIFLTILGSTPLDVTDLIRRKSETDLSVLVHKELKGRRYVIVLDDVWEIDAFRGLKNFFPDDNIGSRIILTCRSKVIGLEAKYHSDPIEPGFLTDEESWDLLEQKVYPLGKCPEELCQQGKQIATKCRGLPLAIVVVAGFLAKSVQTHDLWEDVAGNLNSSYLAHDSQTQWMGPLELSYKVLPDLLKPLFLYFGAFPEDEEIPSDKLIWLWIAEGFLQEMGSESLEMQAEKKLKDLIDRNLVIVSKRSSDGRVKACHVHDLLRDMCLTKAKQENFMEHVNVYQELPDSVLYQRRLSVFLKRTPTSANPLIPYKNFPLVSVTPPLRTLLFFNMKDPKIPGEDPNPDFSRLKLSRIVHFENTITNVDDVMKLLHLRYLSIRTDCNNITESMSNLHNLETLIIKGLRGEIVLPRTVWEMVKLRHLHVNDRASFRDAPESSSNKLENLITLSTPVIDFGEVKKFIKRVPNVQKLWCILNNEHSYSNSDINHCYDLASLDKLESLKASYSGIVRSPGQFKLPESLRKLSLSNFRLEWSQVSSFQKLPNLEVLKLRSAAVEDDFWDTGDDEFPNLKILKLENLNIKRWDASEENFPCLEKLVLEKCKQLEEIPSSIGEINCLEKMEVIWCS